MGPKKRRPRSLGLVVLNEEMQFKCAARGFLRSSHHGGCGRRGSGAPGFSLRFDSRKFQILILDVSKMMVWISMTSMQFHCRRLRLEESYEEARRYEVFADYSRISRPNVKG
jgi:hypothetical protein